jgi:hypothetical protein
MTSLTACSVDHLKKAGALGGLVDNDLLVSAGLQCSGSALFLADSSCSQHISRCQPGILLSSCLGPGTMPCLYSRNQDVGNWHLLFAAVWSTSLLTSCSVLTLTSIERPMTARVAYCLLLLLLLPCPRPTPSHPLSLALTLTLSDP